jgi:hypothetical protein
MNIQPSYGVLAYQAPGKIDLQQLGRSTTKSSPIDTAKNTGLSNTVDKVTISAAAMELAARESNAPPSRTPAQEKLLASCASDAEGAEKIANGMATIPSRVMYDISSGEIRLASTGQSMEDETVRNAYVKNFEREASTVDLKLREIYNTEKAKGTNPAEIVSKMIDCKNSQSSGYLEATAWGMV